MSLSSRAPVPSFRLPQQQLNLTDNSARAYAFSPTHLARRLLMTKVLKCSDVTPGCNFEIRGNSEDEVLKKANEHAKTAHNMQSMPPEVLSKARAAIHDEGEATKKAGA
jgi:predicted small metal-binding protein